MAGKYCHQSWSGSIINPQRCSKTQSATRLNNSVQLSQGAKTITKPCVTRIQHGILQSRQPRSGPLLRGNNPAHHCCCFGHTTKLPVPRHQSGVAANSTRCSQVRQFGVVAGLTYTHRFCAAKYHAPGLMLSQAACAGGIHGVRRAERNSPSQSCCQFTLCAVLQERLEHDSHEICLCPRPTHPDFWRQALAKYCYWPTGPAGSIVCCAACTSDNACEAQARSHYPEGSTHRRTLIFQYCPCRASRKCH